MMERFVEAMRHSGIEYMVMEPHQSFSGSVIAIDADENLHECWEGHSLVNVCVPMRIEDAVRYFKDPSCFSAENAKLREFAREAYDVARGLAMNDPLADVSWLADRMRELGIETE